MRKKMNAHSKKQRKKSKAVKEKLRTSLEIYNQIQWDARLDANAFFIGYQERYAGMQEKRLSRFSPNGDIPWHRIWYIRNAERTVWDREKRIDTLDALILENERNASNHSPLPTTYISHRTENTSSTEQTLEAPVYVYSSSKKRWKHYLTHPSESSVGKEPERLSIVSYNVLQDTYQPERIASHIRYPAICRILRNSRADVIALQEVTSTFLEHILQKEWVQNSYFSSESLRASTVQPYGQIVLSKHPINKLWVHYFTQDKRALFAELNIHGNTVVICVVHLSSSRTPKATEKRQHQLQTILQHVAPYTHCPKLFVGDFNERSDAQELWFLERDITDVWSMMQPHAVGYTFNPARNALAQMQSLTGQPGRLDRIYLEAHDDQLVPFSMRMLGTGMLQGYEELYPSDHFGLSAQFKLHFKERTSLDLRHKEPRVSGSHMPLPSHAQPTYRSALVLIPPEASWAPIQGIRKQHDKSYIRWMPHINLLYGFVPEEVFEDAADKIRHVLQSWQPFSVHLDAFESFQHKHSSTLYLQPDASSIQHLSSLQKALERMFPLCKEQSQRSEYGYHPHLTVAQIPKKSASSYASQIQQWKKQWNGLSFEAGELCLISRRNDEPFEIRHRIPFGASVCTSHDALESSDTPKVHPITVQTDEMLYKTLMRLDGFMDETERHARLEGIQRVECYCEEYLLEQEYDYTCPIVYITGSEKLGVQIPGSDIDAVCILPSSCSKEGLFSYIQERIREEKQALSVRWVENPWVTYITLYSKTYTLDLMLATYPQNVELCEPSLLPEHVLQQLAPHDRFALNSILEAEWILSSLQKEGALQPYRELVRCVKVWARQRSLHTPYNGFLGGLAWAILAAHSVLKQIQDAHEPIHTLSSIELLQSFFSTCAQLPEGQIVSIGSQTASYRLHPLKDRLPILTASKPIQNSARNVTASTYTTLIREWQNAEQHIQALQKGASDASVLFQESTHKVSSEGRQDTLGFTLYWSEFSQKKQYEVQRLIERRILSLILKLESDVYHIRPYTCRIHTTQASTQDKKSYILEYPFQVTHRLGKTFNKSHRDSIADCIQNFIRAYTDIPAMELYIDTPRSKN